MDGNDGSSRKKEKCIEHIELFSSEKKEGELSKNLLETHAKEVDEKINKKLLRELIEKYSEAVEELQEKIEIIEEMSMIDTLTGIYNRKKFLKEFELETKRCARKNSSMTLAVLDIDHFKSVNDTYGHEIGDKVLVEFCSVIKEGIRDIDIFARWGGEEFVIVLGDTSKEWALLVLERLRVAIAEFNFTEVEKITCSIGSVSIEESSPNKMFSKADEALYRAKKNGRNRIEIWEKS